MAKSSKSDDYSVIQLDDESEGNDSRDCDLSVRQEAVECGNESKIHKQDSVRHSQSRSRLPSPDTIRKNTEECLKAGQLPQFQDYGVILDFLVKKYFECQMSVRRMKEEIPWLKEWMEHPLNGRYFDEAIERAMQLKLARIRQQVELLMKGGWCMCTIGGVGRLLKFCFPPAGIFLMVFAYCCDICCICAWRTLFDWWLGKLWRRHVKRRLNYIAPYIKLKAEELVGGVDLILDDEELSLRNVYDSNSYKIANMYFCFLLAAMALVFIGTGLVSSSLFYMAKLPDSGIVQAQGTLGFILLAFGCLGLQFYCRCTL